MHILIEHFPTVYIIVNHTNLGYYKVNPDQQQ